MSTLDLILKLWPLILALAGIAWWAITTHYIQKGRIDVMEQKASDLVKIVDHLTDAGMDMKKEQELLKVNQKETSTQLINVMEGIREIKSLIEKMRI